MFLLPLTDAFRARPDGEAFAVPAMLLPDVWTLTTPWMPHSIVWEFERVMQSLMRIRTWIAQAQGQTNFAIWQLRFLINALCRREGLWLDGLGHELNRFLVDYPWDDVPVRYR
jgi:hypothetical protein